MKVQYGYAGGWAVMGAAALMLTCCAGFAQEQPAATVETAVGASPSGALTMYFLYVDQGDSTVITTPAGKTILIDGGRGGSGYKRKDKGRTVIIPFLKEKGIKRLDYVVMTHADEDHIGGLVTVVAETKAGSAHPLEIGEFIDPGQTHPTYLYKELLAAVMSRPEMKYRNVRSGEKLDFGEGVTAEVFNPPTVEGKGSNAASIVLKVTCGGTSFLLTGDAESSAEKYMTETHGSNLKSTILKAGHHGSNASSGEAFLKAVKPEVVVISVGTKNKFNLPDEDALTRLEATGAKIYRTDYQGTVTVTTKGKGYGITTERELPSVNDRWDAVPALSEVQKLDLNSASLAELDKLPKIGKGLAEEIIKRRPYKNVDELRRVPRIGDKIIERLRPLVTARPPAGSASAKEKGAGEAPAEARAPGDEAKVDINSASLAELQKLPGVGPAIAKAIVEGRPYGTVDDLKNALGVGAVKLEKMRPHITVKPPSRKPGTQSLLLIPAVGRAA